MDTTYIDKFVDYLQIECNYPEEEIRRNTYKYDGKEYWRVDVISDGYIIQAFVLMSEDHCRSLNRFPFYRSYRQWNDMGYLTPPACNVAVFNRNTNLWEIHSSSDLRLELTSPSFLNYDAAVNRFKIRLDYAGNKKLREKVSRISRYYIIFVSLYVTAHIISISGFLGRFEVPMNSSIIAVLILIIVLLLLPPLIPYLKSFSIKGIGFEFDDNGM